MNKKIIGMCSGLLAVTFASMLFVGAEKTNWKTRFDTSLPDLNNGEWKETLHTDFTKIENMEQLLNAHWVPSPHAKRNVEYWCDDMLEFSPNGLIVHSEQRNDHSCDICCASEGIFTGGILLGAVRVFSVVPLNGTFSQIRRGRVSTPARTQIGYSTN